ncbi:MAG: mechanosensitive ion channel [Rhodocyclaceae bacterium]
MIFNPPFRTGDMIQFGGHYGEVVRLDLSATWLRTFNDNTVTIPNAEFLKGAVANSNSGALDEMVVIPVDLPWPCSAKRMAVRSGCSASGKTAPKRSIHDHASAGSVSIARHMEAEAIWTDHGRPRKRGTTTSHCSQRTVAMKSCSVSVL